MTPFDLFVGIVFALGTLGWFMWSYSRSYQPPSDETNWERNSTHRRARKALYGSYEPPVKESISIVPIRRTRVAK